MTFGALNWFWALVLIPLLVVLFARAEKRAVPRLRAFVSDRLLPNLARTVNRRRRKFRFALTVIVTTPEFLAAHPDVIERLLVVNHDWTVRLQKEPAKYASELEKLVTDLALKTREIRAAEQNEQK